jgi:hypothetical protein
VNSVSSWLVHETRLGFNTVLPEATRDSLSLSPWGLGRLTKRYQHQRIIIKNWDLYGVQMTLFHCLACAAEDQLLPRSPIWHYGSFKTESRRTRRYLKYFSELIHRVDSVHQWPELYEEPSGCFSRPRGPSCRYITLHQQGDRHLCLSLSLFFLRTSQSSYFELVTHLACTWA